MFYFLNDYLLPRNSSVEHAAIQRVRLFNQAGQPAQIVTKTYDRFLHRTLATFDLLDTQVLNMYDYFQDATDLTARFLHATDLPLSRDVEIRVGANFSQLWDGDVQLGRVGFIPGSIGRLGTQEHWDRLGNLIEKDLWDWRGFKSATQTFGQDGQLILQRYFTPTGTPALEEFFRDDDQGRPRITRIVLQPTTPSPRYFASREDLFICFLQELSQSDEVTFISDRPAVGVAPLLALNGVAKKYLYLPINHVITPNDPRHAKLDGYLRPAFQHLDRWDGLLTNTAQQAADIIARFPQARVHALPPVACAAQPNVPLYQRYPQSLLYVGRLAPDKQLDQLLQAFSGIRARLPRATLTLYGYGTTAYVKTLQALCATLGVTAGVTFADYTAKMAVEYDHYQILLNTSRGDGGPLAMFEALAHGLPVVSYRFNYGPEELVRSGVNGTLVTMGDVPGMTTAVCSLLQNTTKLAAASRAAYVTAQQWTPTQVWSRWQQVLRLGEV